MHVFLALSSLAVQATAAAAAPFGAAPLAAAPVASVSLASAPFASAPFASAPFASAPFASAPFASAPFASAPFASAPLAVATDRSFLFANPTLDLLALSALSKNDEKPSSALSLLVLSGALNGGQGGLFNGPYYDQYGNYQDPAKKVILLTGVASGNVSPLTALAVDRNPGMTTADSLLVSALGNSPLTSLLVLGQAPGQGLVSNGGILGNLGNSLGNLGNGLGNGGVLPALVVAGAVSGSGNGLGTLLALDALGGLGNNNGYGGGYGYYNSPYYGGFSNPPAYGGFSNPPAYAFSNTPTYGFSNPPAYGGFSNPPAYGGNILQNAGDNLRDILG